MIADGTTGRTASARVHRVRLLRLLVVLLVGAWLVVEIVAIPVADRMLEQEVSAHTHGVAAVKASVGTFPIVTRFVFTGRISKSTITLERVARLALTFTEVRFDLAGVQIDRARLIGSRQARITAVDRATITATLDMAALPPRVAAVVSRNVRVSGRTLMFGSASFEMSSDILPCSPDAHVIGNDVILSCTIDHVPPALLEAAQ